MISLGIAFFITAILYASAGFGGGSGYIALLAAHSTDYSYLPVIALSCNIIVVALGSWRFAGVTRLSWRRIVPLLLLSAPLAFLGGSMVVAPRVFLAVLSSALLVSSFLLWKAPSQRQPLDGFKKRGSLYMIAFVGCVAAFVAGVVGIGGGIFLAPVLHFLRWGTAKEIAAVAAVFILVNSLSGLAGQVSKMTPIVWQELYPFVYLPVAVFVGGFVGSTLGAQWFKQIYVRRATALLVFLVALRLLWRWYGLFGI